MANMSLTKTPIAEQEPKVRARNFKEVTLGYTPEQAIEEAQRCLNCKHKPCMTGCPVSVRIPEFIAKVAEGKFEEAYAIIKTTNALPAVCGRVCPQEHQCEGKCVRGIKGEPVGIGRLERFCADYMMDKAVAVEKAEPNGHKVAVVGGGPSSLTVAGDLAKLGYDVTIYEAFHTAGGVLMYGIPEFRLPKAIVQHEIDNLTNMGVHIMTNMVIGRVLSIDELMGMGYEAVFVGSGAGLPRFMGIPGENSINIMSSNEYLTRVNLMDASNPDTDTPIHLAKNVMVVGGGNTAMDSCRTAKRLGAERVMIVYRRSEAEMPARLEEVKHAKEEGIEFLTLHNPLEYIADEKGAVKQVVLQKMQLGEPDASGRRSPEPIPGATETLDIDMAIVAVGVSPNPIVPTSIQGLELGRKNTIVVNEGMQTNIPCIFAGGDIVRGGATVILAMGDGRKAASSMHEYLQK